jgi:hypothetical protein
MLMAWAGHSGAQSPHAWQYSGLIVEYASTTGAP